jgi:long-chain acyl-CoA synthetase
MVLREHLRSVRERKQDFDGPKDYVKYYLLRLFVLFVFVLSHLYDYVSYPIYFVIYHPWLVRRYKRSNHAELEVRDDCVLYHSLEEPTPINKEVKENGLTTMDAIFDYVSNKYQDKDCLGTREILAEEDEVQPNGKVFRKFVLGNYNWCTFAEFEQNAAELSQGLIQLGLKAKENVAIIAETRAEWLTTAYACYKNNLAVVTIYTNLGNDGIEHALMETEASCVFCSHETLPKLATVSSKCTQYLKNIVVMSSQLKNSFDSTQVDPSINVRSYESVSKLGAAQILANNVTINKPQANDCAIIMYTSGSTGKPKGVMLSHCNLISAMSSLINIAQFKPNDRYIGYLPLAHVLELLAETSCLLYGIKVGYSSPNTLTNKSTKVKSGVKGDSNLLRPTLMCAVPLILERIYKSIVDTMRRQGWAVEELFHYFVSYKMKWQDRGFDTPFLNKTLFRKLRYFLGGRVRLMLTGGAPLSPDTHSLSRTCLCLPVMQGYGLTETTACATVTSPIDRKTGRAGAPLLDVKIKLVNWEEGNYRITDEPNPRGEIHIGGHNVALGYYKNKEKTEEDFYDDEDLRWFRTGDIGEFDKDGVIRIIDRKKDLVKLQGGEYVSYGKVESVLKTHALIESICLYADPTTDYVVAVAVPNQPALKELAESMAITDTSPDALCKNQKILTTVITTLSTYGSKNGLEKFELPKKITLVTDEWTPDSGLVTAAFKIRRIFIVKKYEDEIKNMY